MLVMGRPFFAYMLRCADGSYDVGHTDDLEKRLFEHNEGGKCAYTESRRPLLLIWSQEFPSREEARLGGISAAPARIMKC